MKILAQTFKILLILVLLLIFANFLLLKKHKDLIKEEIEEIKSLFSNVGINVSYKSIQFSGMTAVTVKTVINDIDMYIGDSTITLQLQIPKIEFITDLFHDQIQLMLPNQLPFYFIMSEDGDQKKDIEANVTGGLAAILELKPQSVVSFALNDILLNSVMKHGKLTPNNLYSAEIKLDESTIKVDNIPIIYIDKMNLDLKYPEELISLYKQHYVDKVITTEQEEKFKGKGDIFKGSLLNIDISDIKVLKPAIFGKYAKYAEEMSTGTVKAGIKVQLINNNGSKNDKIIPKNKKLDVIMDTIRDNNRTLKLYTVRDFIMENEMFTIKGYGDYSVPFLTDEMNLALEGNETKLALNLKIKNYDYLTSLIIMPLAEVLNSNNGQESIKEKDIIAVRFFIRHILAKGNPIDLNLKVDGRYGVETDVTVNGYDIDDLLKKFRSYSLSDKISANMKYDRKQNKYIK